MIDAKKKLLDSIFLLYWKWDTAPTDYDDPIPNSPTDLLLKVYDDLYDSALTKYPFRCSLKYARQIGVEVPKTDPNRRYKYKSTLPADFLYANGYWQDEERRHGMQNSVAIIQREARSEVKDYTMEYVADHTSTTEDKLDPWVSDYIALFIASEAADIGGCPADLKSYLLQKADLERNNAGNIDYRMEHRDELTPSIHMFEIDSY